MAIFDDIIKPPSNPAPIEDSLTKKQKQTAADVANDIRSTFQTMVDGRNRLIQHINKNRYDLTPGQAAKSLGNQGGGLLKLAAAFDQVFALMLELQGITIEDVPPNFLVKPREGLTFEIGQDGELVVIEGT